MDYCSHFLFFLPLVFHFRVTGSLLRRTLKSLSTFAQYLKYLFTQFYTALPVIFQNLLLRCHSPSQCLLLSLCCQRIKVKLNCLNRGAPASPSASSPLTHNRVCAAHWSRRPSWELSWPCDLNETTFSSPSAHPDSPQSCHQTPQPRMICSYRAFITVTADHLELLVILQWEDCLSLSL